MSGLEFEFAGNFVLFVFDDFAVKLDQRATLGADQMVVMLVIVAVFVARVAVGKSFLARQPTFGQEFERTINGREADSGVFGFDEGIQILGAGMAFRAQKDFQNLFALRGALEAFVFQMLEKDFLFFLHRVSPQLN